MATKATKKTHDKIMLTVEKRELFGKKLKKVRAEGKIPANIYGKDMKSLAIQVNAKEFIKMLNEAGLTQVVFVNVDKEEIPSMIQNVQVDPVSDMYIHADFKKVNLTQKTEAHVPVLFVGEAEAVAQNKGDMLTLINTLTVEALPTDIPQEIEIDISALKEVDDEIKISDVKVTGNYKIINEPEEVIARIAEHKEESLEPEVEASAVEGAAEGEAAEGAEAVAEGEGAVEGKDAGGEAPAATDGEAAAEKKSE